MAMYNSDHYSDLKLVCGEQEFPVHRNIVCPQSKFFEKALSGNFKEATSRTINLPEDEPDDVTRMVDYFYRQEYNYTDPPLNLHTRADLENFFEFEDQRKLAEGSNQVVLYRQIINVAMYALGEKYMIPDLKDLAVKKFRLLPVSDWSFGMDVIIREVYNASPSHDRELRNLVIDRCVSIAGSVRVPFQNALDEISEANVDYLKAALNEKDARCIALQYDLSKVMQKNDQLTVEEGNMAAEIACLTHDKDELQRTNNNVVLDHQATKAKWVEFTRLINDGSCRWCNRLYNVKVDATKSAYDDHYIYMQCRQCHGKQR